jgi:protein FAM50
MCIVVSGQQQTSFFDNHLAYLSPNLAPAQPHTMASSQPEGRREDMLAKQRLQMREEFERQKSNLIAETEKSRPSTNRFVGQNDSMEDSLKNSTVGLVKLEDFQLKRKALEEAKAREAAMTSDLK